MLPYFNDIVLPYLHAGKNVLVAAHGNSLRSLIMKLENISEDEIVKLEIPTGAPIVYIFNSNGEMISKKKLV